MDARITEVTERQLGTSLVADVPAGVSVLPVAETADFDDVGSLQVDTEVLPYLAIDDVAGTITLAATTANLHTQDTPVVLYPVATERLATLVGSFDSDDDEAMLARVPHALYDRLPIGVRAVGLGESVQADFSLDDLLISDITGQVPLVDGSYIDPSTLPTPPGTGTDGLPPSSSPTPTLVPGLGTLHALWPGVTNHDPVTYAVHLSRVNGFVPSAGTLVATIAGTGITIRADPTNGNLPLDSSRQADGVTPTTVYYVALVAFDDDGAAAPGAQASGTPSQVTGPDIAAETITGDNIVGNTITADQLASVIVMASQMIVTPSTTGQRVEIAPAGIRLIAADGTVLVNLPTDPAASPTFSGSVVTGGLTVTGNARIQGLTNVMEKGSQLSLQAQLTAPSGAPDVSLQYDLLNTGVYSAVGQPYCMDYDPAGRLAGGGSGPTYLFGCNGPAGSPMFQVVEYDPAAGAISRQWTTSVSAQLDNTPVGIARVGAYIVFAYWNFDTGSTYVKIYTQATGAIYSGPTVITSNMIVDPNRKVHMGTDGTNLLFVAWSGTTAGTSPPKVTRYSMPGGAPTFVDAFNLTGGRFTYQNTENAYAANRLITGITGRDGANYCLASYRILADHVTYITTYELFSQATKAKLTTTGFDWSPDCMDSTSSNLVAAWKGGVTYDTVAGAYRGLDSNNGRVVLYSNWVWDPSSPVTSTWWVGYTLFQSAGPYETQITSRASIQLDGANPSSGTGGTADVAMRGKLRVIAPPIATDADSIRIYTVRGVGAPSVTSLRRQTPTSTTAPVGGPVTAYLGAWAAGAAYVNANTFPPGTSVIQSDPGNPLTAPWHLGGDGSIWLPRMTTAQRLASPAKGQVEWNETSGNPEAWDGGGYLTLAPVSDERHTYSLLRNLGAINVPIAYTLDPATCGSQLTFPATRDRLYMVAITVPKTHVTSGCFIHCDTAGTGFTGAMYNGAGLWQFNAAGDAVFIIDSGATTGAPYASAGISGWTWTAPVTMYPDVVYLVGIAYMQTAAGTVAVLRGTGGSAVNGLMATANPFFRCGGIAMTNGWTRAQVMKTWTVAQLVQYTNTPIIGLY